MLLHMNREGLRAEKDPARRQQLKNDIEKIAVTQLERLLNSAIEAERDARFRQRCEQLELGTAASEAPNKMLDLSLPTTIEGLFYNNEFV